MNHSFFINISFYLQTRLPNPTDYQTVTCFFSVNSVILLLLFLIIKKDTLDLLWFYFIMNS